MMTQPHVAPPLDGARGPTSPGGGGRSPARGSASWAALAALILGTLLAACDDDLFEPRWASAIDTVQLFTLARPELNLPSAFSFNARRTLRVESATATGNWDIALNSEGGGLVLLPPGALGITSRARISVRPDATFDEVREAPRDTTEYSAVEPVPAQIGTVYVVRTGQGAGPFGGRCVYYAKMEPVEMDVEVGTIRFRYEANPVCNDRSLVPTVGEND